MNLLLLHPDELGIDGTVTLRDRRQQHITQILKANIGDQIKAGIINGDRGLAEVLDLQRGQVIMRFVARYPAPAALPLSLIIGLCRPPQLRRLLRNCAELGVKQVYLLHTARVEKSYWQSPALNPEAITEQLILGLEQAGDTHMPQVHLRPRFKPFVQDELPALLAQSQGLLAHPGSAASCPSDINCAATLAIGPEGGFLPYEVDLLQQQGMQPVNLGQRILRVENAVSVLTARLYTPA